MKKGFNTDPYAPQEEPTHDTLVDGPSSTPLMSSFSRVAVLVLVAALLIKSRSHPHALYLTAFHHIAMHCSSASLRVVMNCTTMPRITPHRV